MTKDKKVEEQPEDNTEKLQAEEAQEVDERDAKIAELTNDLQRTRADFENYRRQVEQQREQYGQLKAEATVRKFLPLLDDIDRILVPRPRIECRPLAVKAQSPNHQTTREFPITSPSDGFPPQRVWVLL